MGKCSNKHYKLAHWKIRDEHFVNYTIKCRRLTTIVSDRKKSITNFRQVKIDKCESSKTIIVTCNNHKQYPRHNRYRSLEMLINGNILFNAYQINLKKIFSIISKELSNHINLKLSISALPPSSDHIGNIGSHW